MVYYNQNKQKGNKHMTTNSKNSRMRYHGFNNNRMYQAYLRIKRDNKKFERTLSKVLSCIGRTFGFLITNTILCFAHKNREAEMEQQAVEKKIVREEQRIQKQAAYNKKKKKEQEERNELIDQWFNHMGKFVNGEFVTIGLDEYTKMTDEQRREWNGEW